MKRKGAPGRGNNTNKGETVRKFIFQEGELFRVAHGACIWGEVRGGQVNCKVN